MKSVSKTQRLAHQLEDRKRNLAVIEETIRTDPGSVEMLDSVKVFLSHRIESIELELTRN